MVVLLRELSREPELEGAWFSRVKEVRKTLGIKLKSLNLVLKLIGNHWKVLSRVVL